jgi:hypothetical protein
MGRIFVVLVQIVIDAALFGARYGDEFFELCLYQIDFVGLGLNIGDNGQLCHFSISIVIGYFFLSPGFLRCAAN